MSPALRADAARVAADIVRTCRRLYERGLIAGGEGNVSARVGPGVILATPAGASKCDVEAADLVRVRLADGTVEGAGRASTEIAMHLRIYARRADVGAVVHAHPPVATGFATAGEDFMTGVLPEVIFGLGPVPLVPFALPGTPALADAIEPFVARHDVLLLANHGATACGPSVGVAHQRMESLEQAARILLAARLAGRVTPLPDDAVAALLAARQAAAGRDG